MARFFKSTGEEEEVTVTDDRGNHSQILLAHPVECWCWRIFRARSEKEREEADPFSVCCKFIRAMKQIWTCKLRQSSRNFVLIVIIFQQKGKVHPIWLIRSSNNFLEPTWMYLNVYMFIKGHNTFSKFSFLNSYRLAVYWMYSTTYKAWRKTQTGVGHREEKIRASLTLYPSIHCTVV